MARERREQPDPKTFVQVNQRPSLGVELDSGRPWVGVDQQVGHGSADALFELTDEHYASEMAGEPVEGGLSWSAGAGSTTTAALLSRWEDVAAGALVRLAHAPAP